MPRDPIPTYFFALVVVRNEGRFLLVHERNRNKEWYLPAGRAEPRETLQDAAVRETREETGVSIRLTGVVRIEHTPGPDFSRVRAVFLGEPTGDTTPKGVPDEESLGAEWVRVEDLGDYALRGEEVRDLLQYLANGGRVFPLAALQPEMMPYGGE